MATMALKTKYSIGLDYRAHWTGRCPTCNEAFVNNAILLSQAALIKRIKRHEAESHAEVA